MALGPRLVGFFSLAISGSLLVACRFEHLTLYATLAMLRKEPDKDPSRNFRKLDIPFTEQGSLFAVWCHWCQLKEHAHLEGDEDVVSDNQQPEVPR